MVALDEKLCRNDTSPQCGRRRKDAFGRYGNSSAASAVSESSVISVAGNYPNGGLAGNIPNGTTDSLWQGWQVAEERNPFGVSGSTDTPIRQYVWGTYIDECLQINLLSVAGPQGLPAGAYYLLQDLLYRAVALTNSSGQFVEAYDTDAYGNTLIFTGPGADGIWFTDDDVQSNYGANSIIYCGYRFDPETENYYVRNRFYSPTLGRWLTRDPIGYRGGINPYEYVASGPMGNADASGQRRISFAFDAFINGNRRGGWLPEPFTFDYIFFRTDWRGFGQFNPHGGPKGFGNARLYSYGLVNSCDIGHLKAGDYSVKTADGLSEEIGLLNRSGRATSHSYFTGVQVKDNPVPIGGPYEYVTRHRPPYKVENLSPDESRILIGTHANYPLVPLSPSIEYKISFDFKRAAPDGVNVTLSGKRTPFPDFEGYINGQLIYHAESPDSGPSFNDLGFHSHWVQIPTVGVGVRG